MDERGFFIATTVWVKIFGASHQQPRFVSDCNIADLAIAIQERHFRAVPE
jgi:hypothetical protein